MKKIIVIFIVCILVGCSNKEKEFVYSSESLKIYPIADNVFIHETYIQTETWGNVGCNGLVYVNNDEALVFDTPTSNEVSEELINYFTDILKVKIAYVVATHFHEDCLGGLEAFHAKDIPSIANSLTISLAKENDLILPQNGFVTEKAVSVGESEVLIKHVGEGHTRDNVVGYMSSAKVLFGGCLLKSVGAGKGNLADANVDEWSNTVDRIKKEFPDAKIIVPGHGKWGDRELLDYTIDLFKNP